MSIKEKKEQIQNWVKENKFNVMLGLGGIATIVVLAINISKPPTEADVEKELYIEPKEEFDPGRELEMQFVDLETGEILGKAGCYESFMHDMLE